MVQTTKAAIWNALKHHSVAVKMELTQPMVITEKAAAWLPHTAVALIISNQQKGRISKVVVANIHPTNAVLITSLQLEVTTMKAVAVNTQNMAVVQTTLHRLLGLIIKVVFAIRTSLVVVLMGFLLPKDHTNKVRTKVTLE